VVALAAACLITAGLADTSGGAAQPSTAKGRLIADRPAIAMRHAPPPPRTETTAAPVPTSSPATRAVAIRTSTSATILGRYRVVAYYGGPDGPALGALGDGTPDEMATRIQRAARQFAGYGLPVLPAMELIATVAQGAPGPDGTYSSAVPAAAVARYLAAAHRHHMLLILDFQPGRGEFLPQVEAMRRFLLDPSVSVALDPEWKMGPGDLPGRVIGSSSAASVASVITYVSGLVRAAHLPDKLLMVHQFRLAMLPDRIRIRPRPGVEVVFHADGFGTQSEKLATWRALAFPGRPFGTGFKLFLRQDTAMMTPEQVMALHPRPDVITYE
jgi:hypothetical protein